MFKKILIIGLVSILGLLSCYGNTKAVFNKEVKYSYVPLNTKSYEPLELALTELMTSEVFNGEAGFKGILGVIESEKNFKQKVIFRLTNNKDSAEFTISYGVENESFLFLTISTKLSQYRLQAELSVKDIKEKISVKAVVQKIKKDFKTYIEKSVVDIIEYRFSQYTTSTNLIEGIWATDEGLKSLIMSSVSNSSAFSESFEWISLVPNSFLETIGTIKNSSQNLFQFSYRPINHYSGKISTYSQLVNKIQFIDKPIFESLRYTDYYSSKEIWIKVSNSHSSQTKTKTPSKEISPVGTAFSIGQNFLATNYHVVDELNSIYIRQPSPNDRLLKCKVVVNDKINDISILQVIDSSFNKIDILPFNLTTRNIRLGEEVYAFGFPLNSLLGNDLKLTNGTVNSKNGFQGEFSNFQFSANIYPGNSGGPLISKDAEVIGITVAKLKGTEMINYAIKLDYLYYLAKSIDGYNYSNYFDSKNQLTGLPGSAENISKFVFNICGN